MKVVIIGGGASGVFCAITLKKLYKNIDVTILEQNNKLLKKVLKTGNGKCNISNKNISDIYYNDYSLIDSKYNINKILEQYKILLYEDEEGRLYPYSKSSKCVVNIFTNLIDELKINVKLNYKVLKITHNNNYIINDEIKADYIVMATGSKAQEETNGYELVKSLGHHITKLKPALTQVITYENLEQVKGIRWKCNLTHNANTEFGEVMFKEDGVSGIVVMNATSKMKTNDILHFDLMPEYDEYMINKYINKYSKTFIKNAFPSPLYNLINKRGEDIAKTIKDFTLTVKDLKGFDVAQVVSGGVITKEVYKTFESKINKNLYILGELLDVDGSTGGYNLYFAFLSGYVSALDIVNKICGAK